MLSVMYICFLKIGTRNGTECMCFENFPFEHLENLRDDIEQEHCNIFCNDDSNYQCGGANSINGYVSSEFWKSKKSLCYKMIYCISFLYQ